MKRRMTRGSRGSEEEKPEEDEGGAPVELAKVTEKKDRRTPQDKALRGALSITPRGARVGMTGRVRARTRIKVTCRQVALGGANKQSTPRPPRHMKGPRHAI